MVGNIGGGDGAFESRQADLITVLAQLDRAPPASLRGQLMTAQLERAQEIYRKFEKDLEIRLSMGSHRIDPDDPGLVGLFGWTRSDIEKQNRDYDAGVAALKELWGPTS